MLLAVHRQHAESVLWHRLDASYHETKFLHSVTIAQIFLSIIPLSVLYGKLRGFQETNNALYCIAMNANAPVCFTLKPRDL